MFPVLEKYDLAAQVGKYVVMAPDIARKARPGQFVILRLDETGERIPITIADSDPEAGTITMFVQAVGKTTRQMSQMNAGDRILDIVGPLGKPSVVEKTGTVVAIGGGFGIAALYPIVREHSRIGNRVISILGARSGNLLFLEEEMRAVTDEVRISTDDGSYGIKGLVTDHLRDIIDQKQSIDLVIAIGPLVMMRAVVEITRPQAIPTIVSMNPIMMDGTGMCGACRITVGGERKFACVDGPEFDGHLVDFEGVAQRQKMYLTEERSALEHNLQQQAHDCQLEQQLQRSKS